MQCIHYIHDRNKRFRARIPEEIFSELEKFMKEESLEKSASIRKLLSMAAAMEGR